jgi:AraC-like DNA-binding protein
MATRCGAQSANSEVGYDSEAAFSRAFKKVAGVAPATWRRRHAGAWSPPRGDQ